MFTDDQELRGRLSADEQAFYDEFEREANGIGPTSEWAKDRAKAKRRDITNRLRSQPMEFIESLPFGSYEKQIIDAIDNERNARESNDIAPGIIRDGRIYRCSKFIPGQGCVKANFLDEESARNYMDKLNAAYNRLAR